MPSFRRSKACRRASSGIAWSQWRTQSLHAAAFLVDEHRRAGTADAIAHFVNEVADLLGFADVAREQNEAPRAFAAIELDFLAAERFPGAAEDHGF
jgi:hypothetical protein